MARSRTSAFCVNYTQGSRLHPLLRGFRAALMTEEVPTCVDGKQGSQLFLPTSMAAALHDQQDATGNVKQRGRGDGHRPHNAVPRQSEVSNASLPYSQKALFGGNITGRRLRGVKVNPIYQEREAGARETDTQSESALPIGDITIQVYDSLPRSARPPCHHPHHHHHGQEAGGGGEEGEACSGEEDCCWEEEEDEGRKTRASGETHDDEGLPGGHGGGGGGARGGRKGGGETSSAGATAVDCIPWTYLQARSSPRREPVWGAFPGLQNPHSTHHHHHHQQQQQPPPPSHGHDLADGVEALSLNHHDVGVSVLKSSGAGEPPSDRSAFSPYTTSSALRNQGDTEKGPLPPPPPPGDDSVQLQTYMVTADMPTPFLPPAPPYDGYKTKDCGGGGGGYWDFVHILDAKVPPYEEAAAACPLKGTSPLCYSPLLGLKGASRVVSPEDGHLLCACPCHAASSRDVITIDCGPAGVDEVPAAGGGECTPQDQETGQAAVDVNVVAGNKDVSDNDTSSMSPATDQSLPGSDPAVSSSLPTSFEGSLPCSADYSHSSCHNSGTDKSDTDDSSVPTSHGTGGENVCRVSSSDEDANRQPGADGSFASGDVIKTSVGRSSACSDLPEPIDSTSTFGDTTHASTSRDTKKPEDHGSASHIVASLAAASVLSSDLFAKTDEHEHSAQCVLDYQNNNNCRVRYTVRGNHSNLQPYETHVRQASDSGVERQHIQRDDSLDGRVSAGENPNAARAEVEGSIVGVLAETGEESPASAGNGETCDLSHYQNCSETKTDDLNQVCSDHSVDSCSGTNVQAQEIQSDSKKDVVVEIFCSDVKKNDVIAGSDGKKGGVCKLCGCSYQSSSPYSMTSNRPEDDGTGHRMTPPYLYTPKGVTSLLSSDSFLLRADKLDAPSCIQRYLEEASCHFLQQHERQLLYDDVITRLSLPPTPVKRPTEVTSSHLIVPDTGERRDDADSVSYVEELTCQALARITARSKSVKSNGTSAGFSHSRSGSKKSSCHTNSHSNTPAWGTPSSIEDIEAELEELWAREGYMSVEGSQKESGSGFQGGALSVVHVPGTSSDPAFEMIVPYEEDTGYASRRRQRLEEMADKEALKEDSSLKDRVIKAAVCSLLFCVFVAIFVGVAIHFGKESIQHDDDPDDHRGSSASGYGFN